MPRRIQFGAVILFSAALLLSGCSATPLAKSKSYRESEGKAASSEEREDPSPEAMEKRAEAHAHYAAAIVHDWNEDSDLAAGQYYQAALADPADESMVLEGAQRLIQFKENEKARDVLAKATATPGASGLLFAQLGRVYALLGKKELAI